jgi:hypothetical protein
MANMRSKSVFGMRLESSFPIYLFLCVGIVGGLLLLPTAQALDLSKYNAQLSHPRVQLISFVMVVQSSAAGQSNVLICVRTHSMRPASAAGEGCERRGIFVPM